MRERTIKAAEHFGIREKLETLEAEILKFSFVPDVDFDVDNYDVIPHVILVPHYVIPVDDPRYFSLRQNTLSNVLITCARFDLWPSGDPIEDMGEHWYIVRKIGGTWPRNCNAASQTRKHQKSKTA